MWCLGYVCVIGVYVTHVSMMCVSMCVCVLVVEGYSGKDNIEHCTLSSGKRRDPAHAQGKEDRREEKKMDTVQ